MLVIHAGIVTEVNCEQFSNAEEPIFVALPSDGILLFLPPRIKVPLPVSMMQFPLL